MSTFLANNPLPPLQAAPSVVASSSPPRRMLNELYELIPLVIVFGFILNSSINQNLSGLFFTLSSIFIFGLYYLLKNDIRRFTTLTLVIFATVFVYVSTMKLPKDSTFPLGLVAFFTVLSVATFVYDLKNTRVGRKGLMMFISILVGSIMGTVTAILADKTNQGFFSKSQSSSVRCSRPATQAFKCTVYKDGEPIENINVV